MMFDCKSKRKYGETGAHEVLDRQTEDAQGNLRPGLCALSRPEPHEH